MRTVIRSLLMLCALGVPMIVIGLASPGPYAERVLGGGIVALVFGSPGVVYALVRRKSIDREHDERAAFIMARSTKFTFLVMALAVQVYWAYNFALVGNAGDTAFYLLVVFWASFAGAYLYNTVRS